MGHARFVESVPSEEIATTTSMWHEHELREVPVDAGTGGERIREGAAEVAAFVAAGTGLAAFGLNMVQAYYARASFELQREEAAVSAAARAEYAATQRQFHERRRMQAFEEGGLAGLDEFDEWHFDGPLIGFEDY